MEKLRQQQEKLNVQSVIFFDGVKKFALQWKRNKLWARTDWISVVYYNDDSDPILGDKEIETTNYTIVGDLLCGRNDLIKLVPKKTNRRLEKVRKLSGNGWCRKVNLETNVHIYKWSSNRIFVVLNNVGIIEND